MILLALYMNCLNSVHYQYKAISESLAGPWMTPDLPNNEQLCYHLSSVSIEHLFSFYYIYVSEEF